MSLYAIAEDNPANVIDAQGLNNAHYGFDAESCVLFVNMTWKITFGRSRVLGLFPTSPGWTDNRKVEWKDMAWMAVTNYFFNQKLRGFPDNRRCCACAKMGVRVLVGLTFVEEGQADVDVRVTSEDVVHPEFRPDTSPQGDQATLGFHSIDEQPFYPTLAEKRGLTSPSGKDIYQIPIIHELGHMLGLKHPGQALPTNRRPELNSDEDYYADASSLMGVGMDLRENDFQSAFCDHMPRSLESPCDRWVTK